MVECRARRSVKVFQSFFASFYQGRDARGMGLPVFPFPVFQEGNFLIDRAADTNANTGRCRRLAALTHADEGDAGTQGRPPTG
jgi:hypothetical protein